MSTAIERLLDRIVRTQICSRLREKIAELKTRAEKEEDQLKKLRHEIALDIITRLYETECGEKT